MPRIALGLAVLAPFVLSLSSCGTVVGLVLSPQTSDDPMFIGVKTDVALLGDLPALVLDLPLSLVADIALLPITVWFSLPDQPETPPKRRTAKPKAQERPSESKLERRQRFREQRPYDAPPDFR